MKPINIARFVRVFAFLALITLAIQVKLGNMDDYMWVAVWVSLMLLYMFVVSFQLIAEHKKEQQNP